MLWPQVRSYIWERKICVYYYSRFCGNWPGQVKCQKAARGTHTLCHVRVCVCVRFGVRYYYANAQKKKCVWLLSRFCGVVYPELEERESLCGWWCADWVVKVRYTLGSSRHSSEREREKEQTSVKVLSGGEKCHFKHVWISTQQNTHTHIVGAHKQVLRKTSISSIIASVGVIVQNKHNYN